MNYLNTINNTDDLKKIPIKSLPFLCRDIRCFLLKSLSKTGGHLSSNLGVVELSVALHYCLNSPTDKIIWDVGHQAYVHKILTGRKDKFPTLRKFNGLSGFPKSSESEHDAFDVGHSSTSISAGLGYAISRDLLGENNHVVSVIGDGSMTSGIVFEALNNIGLSKTNIIVILNDNQMSIDKNVGALASHLNGLRSTSTYVNTKDDINKIFRKIPKYGNSLADTAEKCKESIKHIVLPGIFFEQLGFKYFGIIDGHNINSLIKIINKAKKINGPILLHIKTIKGKGYRLAEQYPDKFHSVEPFNIKTGQKLKENKNLTYSSLFGETLINLAHKNNKIVAITAAMPTGTGLSEFQNIFPKRFFDVGIAEGHAVTFACGLAKNKYIPVVAIYSTFLQRAYDQIVHDTCIQNLHVVFCLDRAGLVGADGESHQGILDISYLSSIPNMTLLAPKNNTEFVSMLDFAINQHEGPIALRYPRGKVCDVLNEVNNEIKLGKSEYIEKGSSIAILSIGTMFEAAHEILLRLRTIGYTPTLINCRFVCPIDLDMIEDLKNYKYVFVLEENVMSGGFASSILEQLSLRSIFIKDFHSFALPNQFIEQGEHNELFEKYCLDTETIYNKILKYLNS